jgi:hypothetical protein
MTDKFWMGGNPTNCDTCDTPITKKFYDAKTSGGPWGNMCPSCFNFGPGIGKLGTGLGQEYTKQADGRFKKTGG